MHIIERSRTDFDRAKIKLTDHFDRRPVGRFFEPGVCVLSAQRLYSRIRRIRHARLTDFGATNYQCCQV